jgi:hypothetical protein
MRDRRMGNITPNESPIFRVMALWPQIVRFRVGRSFVMIVIAWSMHDELHARQFSWHVLFGAYNVGARVELLIWRGTGRSGQQPLNNCRLFAIGIYQQAFDLSVEKVFLGVHEAHYVANLYVNVLEQKSAK